MKKSFLLFGLAMMGLAGCSSVHQGITGAALQETVTAEHRANVQIGQKISGTSSSFILFGFLKLWGDNKYLDGVPYAGESALSSFVPISSALDEVKSAAAYKAVVSSNADVIVAPSYKTMVNNYIIFKTVSARVDGYKGTIVGFTQKN